MGKLLYKKIILEKVHINPILLKESGIEKACIWKSESAYISPKNDCFRKAATDFDISTGLLMKKSYVEQRLFVWKVNYICSKTTLCIIEYQFKIL